MTYRNEKEVYRRFMSAINVSRKLVTVSYW